MTLRVFRAGAVAVALAGCVALGQSAIAATPPGVLVVAQSIDDAVSFDPAEGYELTTVQTFNNVYHRLVQTSPTDGTNYIIKAYIAVTIGGWGSLPGAIAGALLIALFEVLYPSLPTLVPLLDGPAAQVLFSQTMATIVLYIAVLLILFFRPQGLFGEVIQRRA